MARPPIYRTLVVMSLKDPTFWRKLGAFALVLGVLAVGILRVPSDITFRPATMVSVTPLMTDGGIRQQVVVDLDGELREASTRATFAHPEKGAAVCVQQTTDWPWGRITLALADQRLCADQGRT